MQIGQILEKNIKEIALLCKESFDPIFGETSLEQNAGFIEHMFRKRIPAASLKAVERGKIIGYLFSTPYEDYWEPNTAFMHSIAVKKESREKGIASKLVEKSLQVLKAAGYKAVWLDTGVDNEKAISLYEKYGFTKERYMMAKKF